MTALITTLGPVAGSDLGMILPHEHIFVDLGSIKEANYRTAKPGPVIDLLAPELDQAMAAGVTALVECTPLGVGRRADIVRAVSEVAGFPIVVPTGIYREPWVPPWAHEASQGEIRDWMVSELTDQIEESGVQAGWIKLSASDDGLTLAETKILRAAAQAGKATGAAIGSHTIQGRVVLDQLEILEEEGYPLDRFIWIHTQIEPDLDLHLEVAHRGPWIEYDAIGSEPDAFYVERISRVLEAGLGHRLLLSHDRGWYDPSQPGGGIPRPFTYISEVFLPRLGAEGVGEETIRQVTCTNPFRAFAR
ncbi:MAG: esterase [Anaerolineae bacterium]|jgi:phosphotriesterase-related protein